MSGITAIVWKHWRTGSTYYPIWCALAVTHREVEMRVNMTRADHLWFNTKIHPFGCLSVSYRWVRDALNPILPEFILVSLLILIGLIVILNMIFVNTFFMTLCKNFCIIY